MNKAQEIQSHKRWREQLPININTRRGNIFNRSIIMNKKQTNQDDYYSYLKDPDDSSTYLFAGREYLRDLPVRPTKRTRVDNEYQAASWTTTATTPKPWFHICVHHCRMYLDGYKANVTLLSTIASTLVIVTLSIAAVQIQRLRKSAAVNYPTTPLTTVTAATADAHDDDGGDVHTTPKKKKRKKKKRKTPAKDKFTSASQQLSQCMDETGKAENKIEQHDVQEHKVDVSIELDIGEDTQDHDERLQKNGALVLTSVSCDIHTIVDRTRSITANSTNEPSSESLHMTNFSYHQMASRYESRGLNRQTSLELAANFEMNMFFFDKIKQFLCTSSYHIFGQFSSKIQHQLETNHREIMELPEEEKLQQYRERTPNSLLNGKIMTRCICLAIAARFFPCLMRYMPTLIYSLSDGDIISGIISKLCPYCDTSNIADQSSTTFMISYLARESWRILIYQQQWPLSLRMLFKFLFSGTCLGLCHHFVSRRLCYAILAIMFIPWRDFFVMSGAVVGANVFLTIWMLSRCKNTELMNKQAGREHNKDTKDMIKYYARIIVWYQAGAYVSALVIGFYMAMDSYLNVISVM